MTIDAGRSGFLRHIQDCQNARLPGDRRPFRLGKTQVGWVKPGLAKALAPFLNVRMDDEGVSLEEPEALAEIARLLAEQGLYRLRNEAFDVRERPDGPVLAQIDRGAIPSFGLISIGVHMNGLVRRPDGLHLWIGRRAAHKALDPNKLDHIVAGGVPAGLSPEQTLEKEGEEEAAIPAPMIQRAQRVGRIAYAMERDEGLRRDCLLCYDLEVPEDFTPHPNDDEVAVFELWPIGRVLKAVRDSDAFKFNVNLVLIDLFLRERLVEGDEAADLRKALDQGRV